MLIPIVYLAANIPAWVTIGAAFILMYLNTHFS